MAVITQYHRDTNTTYVYESESYWDPEKKQSRSKRKCIGKIDPETGEMVPTGKRGRRKKDPDPTDVPALYEQAKEEAAALKAEAACLEDRVRELEERNRELEELLGKIHALTAGTLK